MTCSPRAEPADIQCALMMEATLGRINSLKRRARTELSANSPVLTGDGNETILDFELLPKGKGPTPLTYLIDNPEYAGVTIHKLTETPDDGDILVQEKFDIDHNETISSLMVKSQLLAESLLEKLLNDFNEIYDKAIPQVKALSSYQAIPSTERRFVTWSESTTRFRQALRQYGHFGILVELDKQLYITSEAEVTDFDHSFLPGRVIFEDFSIISIAISGGFVIFTKRSLMLINPTSNR